MTDSKAKLLTPEEAAKILNVKPNTVRQWLRNGTLPGVKLAKKIWRIKEEDLMKFIEQGETKK